MMKILENKRLHRVKRIMIAITGFTVLIIGVGMIVLPGPGLVVIPLGLAILASEFLWARRLLEKIKNTIRKQKEEDKHDGKAQ